MSTQPTKRGRKPTIPAEQLGPEYVGQTPPEDARREIAMREHELITAAEQQHQTALLMGRRIGQRQVLHSLAKLLTAIDLEALIQIKESKQYKGFRYLDASGKQSVISTWDEFCLEIEGRSHQTIDLDINNYKELGAEGFEALRTLGIGPGKMRELRQLSLPDEERTALVELAKAGDKDQLLDLVEDLAVRHKVDKDRLHKSLEKKTKEHEAALEANERANKELIEARAKAALLPRMKPDEKARAQFSELEKHFADARDTLRPAMDNIDAFFDFMHEHELEIDAYHADLTHHVKELVNIVIGKLADLRVMGVDAPYDHAVTVLQAGK